MNPRIPTIGPVVYYIRRGEYIKIGHAVDLRRRMRALGACEVLAIEPGSRITELERHAEFEADRVDRQLECFRPSPALMARIEELRARFPVPSPAYLRPRPRRASGTGHLAAASEGVSA